MAKSGVVVVTGGTAGVGRATAVKFARAGWKVGLIARDKEALEETVRELKNVGGAGRGVPTDVADAEAVERAADEIAETLGPIDVWVNDAMATVFGMFWDITPREFTRATEVTYIGCVNGTRTALRHMRANGAGEIVQVGSALAYRGIPLQSAYCGAKHAIRGFTASVRTELVHEKSPVTISMVELPAVNTPQFDWARTHMPMQPKPAGGSVFQPEAAADAIFKAAHTHNREYWLGAVTVKTILGNMIAPFYVDRVLARQAVEGQEKDQPVRADRKDNLMQPVTALHKTHGSFGDHAKARGLLVPAGAFRIWTIIIGALFFMGLGAGILAVAA